MKKFLLPFPQYHSLREATGQAKYGSSYLQNTQPDRKLQPITKKSQKIFGSSA